jgi:RNA polymerase sigma-70 factor (ECF subfamily)
MIQITDRQLVSRMQRGDEAAFSEFFEGHFASLYRFALPRVGGDAGVAEEIVQATLCRAVRKLHTFRGEAALLTWLCTFCRHEISAHYHKVGSMPSMVNLSDDSMEIRAALESLGAEDSQRRSDTARLVQVVLDRLPDRYGDALEWKYIEGLSVNEIATRLGVGAKAAESLLTRARAAFRDAFTAVYGGQWSEV